MKLNETLEAARLKYTAHPDTPPTNTFYFDIRLTRKKLRNGSKEMSSSPKRKS